MSQDPSQNPQPQPMNYEVPNSSDVPTQDERSMSMLIYLLAILTFFVGPLIIWLMKKDQSRFIDHHGKECINFEIWATILAIVVGILTCGIGTPIIALINLIFMILAAIAANKGDWYRIPINVRLIK